VLRELRVESLLLIERAQLRLAEGLNVLTGETGAGKTVLAHALDLLMGGRPRGGIVRPGAEEAYVEGEFAVGGALARELADLLPGNAHPPAKESGAQLVLARRVGSDGHTRAYVNGRSANVADLRELGRRLLSFYGQHEHRKLMLAEAQLEILDRACGPAQRERLRGCAEAHARVRALQGELERVRQLGLDRERELELLEHEIREIELASPEEDEHRKLLECRERLRRLDALREAVGAAGEALSGEPADGAGVGAGELLAAACARLSAVAGVDGELDALRERCEALAIEAQDVAGELRSHGEVLAVEDGSLHEVEERIELLERLMRKHGGTIASVLEHLRSACARREQLNGAEHAERDLGERLARARATLQRRANELRAARQRAARTLEDGVRAQLQALAMGHATFEVALVEAPMRAGGADEARFMIAPNPGVAAAPLREIASGGELSRVMLALATVAAGAEEGEEQQGECMERGGGSATLVFDEIDAGVGGHTARAVGERLRDLARSRQIICITHLPQIASLAHRHFSLVKHSSSQGTRTAVVQLSDAQVLGELVRMLGADERDSGARRHAEELLRAA
jgi:DNA repair protein RecN (Recombination protein N)